MGEVEVDASTDTRSYIAVTTLGAKPGRQDACRARHQQDRNNTDPLDAAARARRPALLRACSIVGRPRNLWPRVVAPLPRRAMQDLPARFRCVAGLRAILRAEPTEMLPAKRADSSQ
jgi:hypothetical protein